MNFQFGDLRGASLGPEPECEIVGFWKVGQWNVSQPIGGENLQPVAVAEDRQSLFSTAQRRISTEVVHDKLLLLDVVHDGGSAYGESDFACLPWFEVGFHFDELGLEISQRICALGRERHGVKSV